MATMSQTSCQPTQLSGDGASSWSTFTSTCTDGLVTLKFGFQVELCRVDVELWPWGMDRGQACKRLEISTSSDPLPTQNTGQGHKQVQQKEQMQVKDQNKQKRKKQQESDRKSCQSNGHQWSFRARQWDESEPQQRGHAFKCLSNTESNHSEPEFKLVGRCELREETRICFTRSNFSPRPPFPSPPPPQPPNCRQEELWSRGLLSLGAVTQPGVTVPLGGAASALGLKTLVVWGQPARCCPAEEVERVKRLHEASERRPPQPVVFIHSVSHTKPTLQAATPPSNLSIPEEFLDPITQEVMLLPMLLPSGMSVDNTTLEEHQKREATWGRPPTTPSLASHLPQPLSLFLTPQLKSRIDHFLLQNGMMKRDGMLGRQREEESPQASRLMASTVDEHSRSSPRLSESSTNSTFIQHSAGTRNTNRMTQIEKHALEPSSDNGNEKFIPHPLTTNSNSELDRRKKQDRCRIFKESTEASTAEKQLLPQTKRPRTDAVSVPSCSSHEERLSASLDEALFSALQGRPSFTSNLSQQTRVASDSEQLNASQHCRTAGTPSVAAGEKTCSACSCSLSVYSKSASSIYRLTCSHLLCRSCLRRESQPLNSATVLTSNQILCPACKSPTPRTDVIRVHH